MSLTLVAVKLTPTELAVLDEMVGFSVRKSRSHVIICALQSLFEQQRLNSFTALALSAERSAVRPRSMSAKGKDNAKKEAPVAPLLPGMGSSVQPQGHAEPRKSARATRKPPSGSSKRRESTGLGRREARKPSKKGGKT